MIPKSPRFLILGMAWSTRWSWKCVTCVTFDRTNERNLRRDAQKSQKEKAAWRLGLCMLSGFVRSPCPKKHLMNFTLKKHNDPCVIVVLWYLVSSGGFSG
jgi:hypothetical protein